MYFLSEMRWVHLVLANSRCYCYMKVKWLVLGRVSAPASLGLDTFSEWSWLSYEQNDKKHICT